MTGPSTGGGPTYRKNMVPRLVEALRKIVKDRMHDSFAAYLANLSVRAAEQAEYRNLPIIVPENEAFLTYLTFIAAPEGARCACTVRVKVDRKPKSSVYYFETPLVLWRGAWLSIKHFLDVFADSGPSYRPFGQEGFEALWRWYKHRKSPFRFLDLPAELRLNVYEFAAGELYPSMSAAGGLSLGNGWKRTAPVGLLEGTGDPVDEVPPPDKGLILSNKQVHAEVMSVIWAASRQSFAYYMPLMQIIDMRRPADQPTKFLNHLGLKFNMINYFRFFGLEADEGVDEFVFVGAGQAKQLSNKNLPNLKSLEIKFRSPRYGPYDSPWSAFQDPDDIWRLPSACHKVLTMVVLTLAFEHIHHIKYLTVEGYIKDSTKAQFEAVINSKAWREDPEQTGDWPMSKDQALDIVGNLLAPACQCTNKCGFYGAKVVMGNRPPKKLRNTPEEIFKQYTFDRGD